MLAYTYVEKGKFGLKNKPKPELRDSRDALVKVTLASICTSDVPYPPRRSAGSCAGGSPSDMRWWGLWKASVRM